MRQPTTDKQRTLDPDPAEGRPDLELPGADHPEPRPDAPETPDADVPQRLGERIENGPGAGIGSGAPDVLPDVDVPDESM